MKKANAGIALVTDILLALHMWIMSYSLFTGWYDFTLCKTLGRALCTLFIIHAVLTICIFFFCHDGTAITCKKKNIGTIMQRAEGVLMLLFIHSHIGAYGFMATGETLSTSRAVLTCIAEVIFIFAVSAHSALSSSKALITLGIVRSERAMNIMTRIFGALVGASGIAAVIAVIRFFAVM